MRIFINDQMAATILNPDALNHQLQRFERRQLSALAIGDADAGYCRAEWDEAESCMLHLLQKELLSGVRIPGNELHQVRAIFEEFFRGFKPLLPTRHLMELLTQDERVITIGDDFEDDCPLCQMEKARIGRCQGGKSS